MTHPKSLLMAMIAVNLLCLAPAMAQETLTDRSTCSIHAASQGQEGVTRPSDKGSTPNEGAKGGQSAAPS